MDRNAAKYVLLDCPAQIAKVRKFSYSALIIVKKMLKNMKRVGNSVSALHTDSSSILAMHKN